MAVSYGVENLILKDRYYYEYHELINGEPKKDNKARMVINNRNG